MDIFLRCFLFFLSHCLNSSCKLMLSVRLSAVILTLDSVTNVDVNSFLYFSTFRYSQRSNSILPSEVSAWSLTPYVYKMECAKGHV